MILFGLVLQNGNELSTFLGAAGTETFQWFIVGFRLD